MMDQNDTTSSQNLHNLIIHLSHRYNKTNQMMKVKNLKRVKYQVKVRNQRVVAILMSTPTEMIVKY